MYSYSYHRNQQLLKQVLPKIYELAQMDYSKAIIEIVKLSDYWLLVVMHIPFYQSENN